MGTVEGRLDKMEQGQKPEETRGTSLLDDMFAPSLDEGFSLPADQGWKAEAAEIRATLKAQGLWISGMGVRLTDEATFECFEDLKGEVAKNLADGSFGKFVDAWLLTAFCNLSFVSEAEYLIRGKNVLGNGFTNSSDAQNAGTFEQRYSQFLVGAQKEFRLGTLLPGFTTLDRWSKDGAYGSRHELERELKNARRQLSEEIRMDLSGKMKALASYLLDTSYDFMMMLLRHTDSEVSILQGHGFEEKDILSLLSDQMRQVFDDMYHARVTGKDKLGQGDTVHTAASFVWATLQSHVVMANYAYHDFRRHPSITFIFV